MDGPSHYTEAENMYIKARQAGAAADGVSASLFIQAALFHATMAHTATQAQLVQRHLVGSDYNRWENALNYNPQEPEEK